MKKIIYNLSIVLITLLVGCTDEVEFSSKTEALGDFNIISPASSTSFTLNSGTPDKIIQFNWAEAIPGVSKKPTYTVALYLVDEENPFISFSSDNEGASTKLSSTFSVIDQALDNAGFDIAENANIQWQVIATNGDVEVKTAKTNITLTRFSDNGIMAFNLLTPANNNVVKADVYGTPNTEVEFTWEKANTTSGGGTIEYTVLFDELNGDFSEPLFSFPVTSGLSFSMTHQEIGEAFALNSNVKWTVKAKVANSTIELKADAKYVNWDIFIINKLFLVGDHNGWNNATANSFTNKGNGLFEIQINLTAGQNFKFLPTIGSWEGDWGKSKTEPGKIVQENEDNINVSADGTYVIKVNFATLSYTVSLFTAPANLYLVGDHNGWNPATAPQFYNNGAGVFSIVQKFDAGNNFKFLETLGTYDGDWGKSKTETGKIVQENEDNVSVTTTGTYVVIVDFNTQTYNVSSIDNLYMVGDHNGWNNTTAPQLSTTGNGIFSIVQSFDAGNNFKFLPTLGSWDGDWGKSKTESGKIVQEDEDNLSVTTAGKYVVAVNYNTMSYTVSKITGTPANLYLVGGFNGWSNTAGNPQFTQTSAGVFEITQTLSANDEFKFVPVAGDWGNDFGESKVASRVLEQNDENNLKVTAAGSYKIIVNFNKGNISVVLQ